MIRTALLAALLPFLPLAQPTAAAAGPPPAAVEALHAAAGGGWFWTGDPLADARRQTLLALLAAERRLDPAAGDPTALAAAFAAPGDAARREAERALSDAALAYLARRAGGAEIPPGPALRALRGLERAAKGPSLALALAELDLVAALGGWRAVGTVPGPPPKAAPLRLVSPEVDVAPALPPRKRLPDLGDLRRRLVQSADLSARYLFLGDGAMDAHTARAVRLFQARHGLAADGVVGPRTLATLNAPVAGEVARARINLLRGPEDRGALPRYVEVNVPGYELRFVEGGKTVLRSRVIVGDEESATPIFDDLMRTVEVNPSWYVPRSIEAELVAKEARRPGYLAANDFRWRPSTDGGPDRLIQRPGPENGLGRFKFLFPNHHAVYLHDTPERGLFGRSRRSLSHGCVRVEKPFDLALVLLRPQGWDAKRLEAALAGAKTRRIELAAPVPVFLDYRTALVDEGGRLQLRADLYGHDAAGVTRFAGKGLPPEFVAPAAPGTVQVSPLPRPAAEKAAGPTSAAFLVAPRPAAPSL